MRAIALALLLLITACGQGDRATNQPGPQRPAETTAALPAIAITAMGTGGCAATWDGQAVTPFQITQRGVALLGRAIAAAGGRRNVMIDSLPVPNVQAPADLGIACADTILTALWEAGFPTLTLKLAGADAAVIMDFPTNAEIPPPPVPMVVGLRAGGRVTWNNDPLDEGGLAAQLTQIGGGTAASDAEEGTGARTGFELRVQSGTTFGQLYQLLHTIHRYHLRPEVYLPSVG